MVLAGRGTRAYSKSVVFSCRKPGVLHTEFDIPLFSFGARPHALTVGTDLAVKFYGGGEIGEARRCADVAIMKAVVAIASLDAKLSASSVRATWQRAEQQIAIANALNQRDPRVDPPTLFASRLAARASKRPILSLRDIEERERDLAATGKRERSRVRQLASLLAGERGRPSIPHLAEAVRRLLGDIGPPRVDLLRGQPEPQAGRGAATCISHDEVDIRLALPYAFRRLGITRNILPALCGPVQVLGRDTQAPVRAIETWADGLRREAIQAANRLSALEGFVITTGRRLGTNARSTGLMKVLQASMEHWLLYAELGPSQLDRSPSAASRLLAQAEAAGVIDLIHLRGTRGNAIGYTSPVWRSYAEVGRRERERLRPGITKAARLEGQVAVAAADVDAELAAFDRKYGAPQPMVDQAEDDDLM